MWRDCFLFYLLNMFTKGKLGLNLKLMFDKSTQENTVSTREDENIFTGQEETFKYNVNIKYK